MKTTLLLLMASLTGCAGLAANFKEKRYTALIQRATFELRCPQEDITVVALDADSASHGGGTTGVRGCGKQATYVWDAQWERYVLNAR